MRPQSEKEEISYWRRAVPQVLAHIETPCFVFAAEPLAAQWGRLQNTFAGMPVRHWWSYKTLPLAPAVRWWKDIGGSVEIVSEHEFHEVRRLGFGSEQILINGPAKQAWLGRQSLPNLRVNFDSLTEIKSLGRQARALDWRIGVRVNTRNELHSEHFGVRGQFGLLPEELPVAARQLKRHGLRVEVLHFHLRTNVPRADMYLEAAAEVLAESRKVGWKPAILDVGGGMPPARVQDLAGRALNAEFSLAELRRGIAALLQEHTELKETWMENGRWLTAPAAVLVLRVLDIKEGRGARTLLCDGGRTLHAMVATWERHRLLPLARRPGRKVPTLVCGPTCMAFDNLGCHPLPAGIRIGDVLLWFQAGAYQLPWETRFSHGLAGVAWVADGTAKVVRKREADE